MALHDVDKGSEDRGSPTPNTHDTIIQGAQKSHGTNSVHYTSDATTSGSGPAILGGNARLVASGIANAVILDGVPGTITLGKATVPHNLGYAPAAQAYINNAKINGVGPYNLPLPTIISVGDNEVSAAEIAAGTYAASDFLGIKCWMFYATDSTNFYVISYSSGGMTATTIGVTYYLYQQTAQ